MSNVQDIFNKVIDNGFYEDNVTSFGSFMCVSLDSARMDNVITEEEMRLAQEAIYKYIGDCFSLSVFLLDRGRPRDYYAKLLVYKNWSKRPYREGTLSRSIIDWAVAVRRGLRNEREKRSI